MEHGSIWKSVTNGSTESLTGGHRRTSYQAETPPPVTMGDIRDIDKSTPVRETLPRGVESIDMLHQHINANRDNNPVDMKGDVKCVGETTMAMGVDISIGGQHGGVGIYDSTSARVSIESYIRMDRESRLFTDDTDISQESINDYNVQDPITNELQCRQAEEKCIKTSGDEMLALELIRKAVSITDLEDVGQVLGMPHIEPALRELSTLSQSKPTRGELRWSGRAGTTGLIKPYVAIPIGDTSVRSSMISVKSVTALVSSDSVLAALPLPPPAMQAHGLPISKETVASAQVTYVDMPKTDHNSDTNTRFDMRDELDRIMNQVERPQTYDQQRFVLANPNVSQSNESVEHQDSKRGTSPPDVNQMGIVQQELTQKQSDLTARQAYAASRRRSMSLDSSKLLSTKHVPTNSHAEQHSSSQSTASRLKKFFQHRHESTEDELQSGRVENSHHASDASSNEIHASYESNARPSRREVHPSDESVEERQPERESHPSTTEYRKAGLSLASSINELSRHGNPSQTMHHQQDIHHKGLGSPQFASPVASATGSMRLFTRHPESLFNKLFHTHQHHRSTTGDDSDDETTTTRTDFIRSRDHHASLGCHGVTMGSSQLTSPQLHPTSGSVPSSLALASLEVLIENQPINAELSCSLAEGSDLPVTTTSVGRPTRLSADELPQLGLDSPRNPSIRTSNLAEVTSPQTPSSTASTLHGFAFLKSKHDRRTRERSETEGSHSIFKELRSSIAHRRGNSGQAFGRPGDDHDSLNQMNSGHRAMHSSGSEVSLLEKYGKPDEVLGKGANATVRLLTHRKNGVTDKLYAIKEFRKLRKDETEKDYIKKVISEFCISSSMHHENIVETVDLIRDEHGRWCEVMEYCSGGDLFNKTMQIGFSGNEEIYCLFRQLLGGVGYMHSIGVAHRDLKPENLLLDETGKTLKVTDFGTSAVFRTQWEKEPHKLHGICGSQPYIAPEEWDTQHEYIPTKVDVWACGMILYAMLSKNLLWKMAQVSNEQYATYLRKRETGFPQFLRYSNGPNELLHTCMNPDPLKRPEISQLITDPWVAGIDCCRSAKSDTNNFNSGTTHTHLHPSKP
ncbi:hypothetical protein BASA61_002887 [Batrachochytrium salamandrivorans]|nr:hypothetical protein BASA61_002887 [Batrachochytrium salamandrivorans]